MKKECLHWLVLPPDGPAVADVHVAAVRAVYMAPAFHLDPPATTSVIDVAAVRAVYMFDLERRPRRRRLLLHVNCFYRYRMHASSWMGRWDEDGFAYNGPRAFVVNDGHPAGPTSECGQRGTETNGHK